MKIGKLQKLSPAFINEMPVQTRVIGIEEVNLQSKDKKKTFKQLQIETEDGILCDWDCYPCELEIGDMIRIENPDKKSKVTVTVLQKI